MPKAKVNHQEKDTVETMTETTTNVNAANAGAETPDFTGIIGTVQEFLPEELVTDAGLNVRTFGAAPSKKETERTKALAETIRQVGQLQDAGAYPVFNPESGEIEYHLFMGNRRKAAITMLNEQRAEGTEPLSIRVRIFAPEDAKELKRKALIENIHRENYTPLSLAHNIQTIRKDNGWDDPAKTKDWSKRVAEYLGVSRAQITQHVRLIEELPTDIQKRIEAEGLSAQAAFELLDTVPEKRETVLEGAKVEAGKDAAKAAKAAAAKKPGKKTEKPEKADVGSTSAPAQAKAKGKDKDAEEPEEKEKGAVTSKHIRKAARAADAMAVKKSLKKSEIVDFFREVADSPAYGNANSPVRAFAGYFVDKFCAGTGSDKTALTKFDSCVMSEDGELYAGEGTPSKAELEARAEEDARAAERDAKKPKTKKSAA